MFAPSSAAAYDVLRDKEGFAADTVQQLLVNERMQQRLHGQVIWVDEAGLLSTRQMRRLFAIAERQNVRVILSGDTRQHGAVERGDALRILEEEGAVISKEITTIHRQEREAYKDIVYDLSASRVVDAFAKMEAQGFIVELAREYLAVTSHQKRGGRETALVIAPTHAEGRMVTEHIRGELQRTGRLGTQESAVVQLKNLQWTEAERGDGARYEAGHIVQFIQNGKGVIKKGARLIVMGRDAEGHILARDGNGVDRVVSLEQAARFQVYEAGTLPVVAGDRLRVTQGGHAGQSRLSNGRIVEVAGFTPEGDIATKEVLVIHKAYGHIDYGYSVTSHASQGSTVDHVLIAQSAASGRAASQEQLYVSVSRGKKSAHIFTDDKDALLRAVQHSSARHSAHDLMRGGQISDDMLRDAPEHTARMTAQVETQTRMARIIESLKQNLYRGMETLRRYGITGWTPERSGGSFAETIRNRQEHDRQR